MPVEMHDLRITLEQEFQDFRILFTLNLPPIKRRAWFMHSSIRHLPNPNSITAYEDLTAAYRARDFSHLVANYCALFVFGLG